MVVMGRERCHNVEEISMHLHGPKSSAIGPETAILYKFQLFSVQRTSIQCQLCRALHEVRVAVVRRHSLVLQPSGYFGDLFPALVGVGLADEKLFNGLCEVTW